MHRRSVIATFKISIKANYALNKKKFNKNKYNRKIHKYLFKLERHIENLELIITINTLDNNMIKNTLLKRTDGTIGYNPKRYYNWIPAPPNA